MKKIGWLIALLLLCCVCAFGMFSCNDTPTAPNGGEEITAHEHSFMLEKATEEFLKSVATCQSPAIYYKSCSCGERGEETFLFGETGAHLFEIMAAEERFLVSAATCEAYATYHYSCLCGEMGEETFSHGEMAEHSFDGYVCSNCSYEKSSDGLIYKYHEDADVWTLVGFDENVTEDVHIAWHNGSRVFAIDVGALKNCTTIRNLYIGDCVEVVRDEAFYGCENLESVHFGKDVSYIGQQAFAYTDSLNTITVSEENEVLSEKGDCLIMNEDITLTDGSVENRNALILGCRSSVIPVDEDIKVIFGDAFCGRTGIEELHIPDSVREIMSMAFAGCTDLREVTIGKGVTYIGEYAFDACTSLARINYNAVSLTACDEDRTFRNAGFDTDGITLVIGKDVKIVPNDLFANNIHDVADVPLSLKLKTLEFADDCVLQSIGLRAFYNAPYLQSVSIPSNVSMIGKHAFANCAAMTSLSLPESEILLDEECFAGCTALQSLMLGCNTMLSYRTFSECTALESLTIPDGMTEIGDAAFADCTSLRFLSIPKSVEHIGYGAFVNCYALSQVYFNAENANDFYDVRSTDVFGNAGRDAENGVSVEIGKDVKRIPAYMASYMNLYSVSWEDGSICESIGEFAFSRCRNLVTFTLPSTLKTIDNAFSGCSSLVQIYNYSEIDVFSVDDLKNYILYVHTDPLSESKLVYDGDFVFFVNGDDRRLVAYFGKESELVLPASCEGHTYWVNNYMFCGNDTITSVEIPETVTLIGKSAFETTSITSIVIPGSVTRIDDGAFIFSSSLKTVIIKKGVSEIGSKTFNLDTVIYCEEESRPDGWTWVESDQYLYYNWHTPECTVYWYSEETPTTDGNYWHYVDGEPTVW